MDWVVPISTIATAIVTGSVSLLTLRVANRHADGLDERHSRDNRERLRFEARERRYEDRRDAVIALDEAAEREARGIEEWEDRAPPGFDSPWELHAEYRFPELTAAHARVVMLATPDVVTAADRLRSSVVGAYFGKKNHWDEYRVAIEAYREASRRMLANE